ncbi:MAG: Ribosomal protein L30 [Candidatus Methanohalarchaeum thermophilum]|uniref:Large ribosomal subunit protein uL30 n=1 Tax=Methanohalarchaeum thermophilum TaxID=1903181 RepID=A0A1Q6DX23_METT1|nr:MAG: Ribosomal protein L30 [Candidatus Methanohalarchaeum thermophilum]
MYAVIRIRGTIGVKEDIKDTMKLLNLEKTNHCVLLEEKKENEGMLQKAKDYLTWGEVNKKGLKTLLKRADPNEQDLDSIKEEYGSLEQISEQILENNKTLQDLGLKKVIRLHPPRKGFKNKKRDYKEGGSLGYRGKEINKLIKRMR